ncbi:MAG: Alw26I/Eco31I/Esp3I family type II restriction-modification system subunit R [Candidatus Desulfovibrio kirbyi]|jgi:Alw26I/Eco31I/Esp3I family type II restriction endonuclease|uniref:Alw26I/Eco31I/Esp3I family type II restriction-modification system subunit R n=1 Tax=Candidatus Desulfovibrio kirbyi TaxID=2696086 RepID=A0A6L2R6I3_9BACT|nr:MAG: Alw26I/Eco31I/Esp3I family type II restriction-modification system subunit R [Candidatus Desulfovibrio kirbyi]
MAKTERKWHPDFLSYMETIVKHPNYSGLPIERKRDGLLAWVASAKTTIGKRRIKWAEDKARSLGMHIQPGVYANVMLEIHPTKIKVCQICGSHMSIYYHYPSVNFLKAIESKFGLQFTGCNHIGEIWEKILESGVPENTLMTFFKSKFELEEVDGKSKNEIIDMCERKCREDGKALLSPGAMSNFPDRYDGFHTYNRCCRATQDKGRSRENLKSYTKDRRAYEYWSDGNLHAADMFMGSQSFSVMSADHMGPISLGFVHDPRYIRPMTNSDNSTKRDRLLVDDIKAILTVEAASDVSPMSWFSAEIWEFIKTNYDKQHADIVATVYRDMLKQNLANYMFVLKSIVDDAEECGRAFLVKEFIDPKYEGFHYAYKFDANGNIVKQTKRNITERGKKELDRFRRIAFQSLEDYATKDNRHLVPNLTEEERAELVRLCAAIKNGDFVVCRKMLERLVSRIETRIIQTATTA